MNYSNAFSVMSGLFLSPIIPSQPFHPDREAKRHALGPPRHHLHNGQ